MRHDVFVRMRFEFDQFVLQPQAKLGPSDFLASLDLPHVLSEHVAGDTQQPGPDQNGALETGVAHVRAEEDFLRQILGVGGLQQSRTEVAIDATLMRPSTIV